ncbi:MULTISPECIES: TRAP transporter substrate-binding protein [unclassified Leisingera]|uniref:TRAP transporter substrate-binding protein n=1 Tax=unclassified Leisingera TaxID=2614906 RepID=UPI0002F955D8|nr:MULTISPECIES: TRAP transporter substrate-binding protein [unclassified Leisingera]KIC18278.1 C4-dicarboxylate ABC transporter [Leisingera sp. ANG-DT]KIC24294.1 C4-dicarboxylate ABC transporter [Leisingera sp. ANG-S3]KIC53010.1 C4-dicarboxylate ABC transporter [Leisingera sp. ANG-S]KID10090.1 C4-dicarboxylate ABC transporter [Leisingera sp. ANG1]
MTTRRKLLGAAGAAALAVFGAMPAFAQEVTLKLHQFLPAQANVPKLILDVWADNVEEASGGRIKIDRFPSMQLGGKPPELMDQAIDGVADIVWTVVGYTPGRYPSTEVFELPFMMTNARAVSHAYWEMFDKHMKDTEFKDVHILGTWVHGPGMIHTSDPVETPEDLEGMKIRGGGRSVNALLTELGATPVGMPVPAIPEGLSKGVIDGTTIPWEVTAALKVPELVENHTEFTGKALYTLTFVLAMNKDKYKSLPDDLKKAIDDNSGLEFSVFAGGTQADSDGPSREMALDLGNNVITLDEEQTAIWRERAQPIYDQWIADMKEKGIDGAALIEEASGLIEKYTPQYQ